VQQRDVGLRCGCPNLNIRPGLDHFLTAFSAASVQPSSVPQRPVRGGKSTPANRFERY